MNKQVTHNQKSIIVGLGQSGYACARYLYARKQNFAVADTRENPPYLRKLQQDMPNIRVYLGEFKREIFDDAHEMIVSPGVAIKEHYEIRRAIRNGVKAVGDIELFARSIGDTPVVAITGSNGKSTVTTLVGEMAKADNKHVGVGGNIGIPVMDLLEQGKKELYVLELSSFQLETTESLEPWVATVLNLSADHMDRYKNMAEYHQAKHRIFKGAKHIVVNRQDPLSMPLLDRDVKTWTFGVDKPSANGFGLIEEHQQIYLAFEDQKLLPVKELKIHGLHNYVNALAALALGYAVGLTMSAMVKALKNFPGLPHRCEFIGEAGKIAFYNDSKATNVGAAVAAIQGLGAALTEGKIILIAGGYGKGSEFLGLLNPMIQYGRGVILIGVDGDKIAEVFLGKLATQKAEDMVSAVKAAFNLAQPGDIVLLAPACASFDMFENFEHRGKMFSDAVKQVTMQ